MIFGLSNAQAAATLAAVLIGHGIIMENGERLLNDDVYLSGTTIPGTIPDSIDDMIATKDSESTETESDKTCNKIIPIIRDSEILHDRSLVIIICCSIG